MHFRAASILVLVAATSSACGSGGGGARSAPVTTDTPTPFAASSASAPEGFTAAECAASVDGKPATLKLVVPDGFSSQSVDPSDHSPDGECTWDDPDDRFFSVQVGQTKSLAAERDELEEFEDIGGDDSVEDVTYEAPAELFGGLEGERLTWWSYSDGSPADCVEVQANGIRLYWRSPDDLDQRLDDFDMTLDSVELVRS